MAVMQSLTKEEEGFLRNEHRSICRKQICNIRSTELIQSHTELETTERRTSQLIKTHVLIRTSQLAGTDGPSNYLAVLEAP
jgi:hypothetical protein